MNITSASITDREGLKQLWKTVFRDDDEFINAFFSEQFVPSNCIVAKEEGVLAGMLFLLPATMQISGWKLSCGYVYGVATDFRFRGIGVMRSCENACTLLANTLRLDLLALVPQNRLLFDTYQRLGYDIASYKEETVIVPEFSNGMLGACSAEEFIARRDKFLQEHPVFIDVDDTVKEFRFTAGLPSSPLIYRDDKYDGYIIGAAIGNKYLIHETSLPLKGVARAGYAIKQQHKDIATIYACNLGGKRNPYGMVKPISGVVSRYELCENQPYMNLMLD